MRTNDDAELLGELDAARMHDASADARQFEHFVVADLIDLAGAGGAARVGGVNAINVGENFADVGPYRAAVHNAVVSSHVPRW